MKTRTVLSLILVTLTLVAVLAGCGGKEPTAVPTVAPAQATAVAAAPTQAQAAPAPTAAAPTKIPAVAPTQPPAQPPEAPIQSGAGPTPTKLPASGGVTAALSEYVDPDTLDSYRQKTIMRTLDDPSAKPMEILTEYVKAGPARHTTMGEIETITIGPDTWIKMMGQWIHQDTATDPTTTQQAQATGADFAKVIEDQYTFKELGRETINGIACRHVSYEGAGTVQITEGAMKGEATVSGKGEMWIADQAGLPKVVVKSVGESTTTLVPAAGSTIGTFTLAAATESELYDINTPIKIEPPEGVMSIPTMPAALLTAIAAATKAPSPAAAAATAAPAAVAPTATPRPAAAQPPAPTKAPSAATTASFDFAGALDASWDVLAAAGTELSTSARPGYLRITAADGFDLVPWGNFEAPRAWQTLDAAAGDFTAELRVEFSPEEDFQGAGLLVWHDEQNFLRLERCYGGLSGGESGICFLAIENGEPQPISGAVDTPTDDPAVDLRIERSGDSYIASWRPAGSGAWQSAGEHSMDLSGELQVGVLLVAAAGVEETVADFDSFSLTE